MNKKSYNFGLSEIVMLLLSFSTSVLYYIVGGILEFMFSVNFSQGNNITIIQIKV